MSSFGKADLSSLTYSKQKDQLIPLNSVFGVPCIFATLQSVWQSSSRVSVLRTQHCQIVREHWHLWKCLGSLAGGCQWAQECALQGWAAAVPDTVTDGKALQRSRCAHP